ncbi:MAG: hypothetical protein K2R98_12905 [Gemmataceae bacterium]|nr:hypothetical protein [Gemmataceae bacterium]
MSQFQSVVKTETTVIKPMGVDRNDWPFMVRLGLWGLPSRGSAWAFFWLSVAIAVGCVTYGFARPVFFFGGFLIFSALWYYVAIRWVDRHGRWS